MVLQVKASRLWAPQTLHNRAASSTGPALHSCNRPSDWVDRVICLLRPICWVMTKCNCWPRMCTAFLRVLINSSAGKSSHSKDSARSTIEFRTLQRGAEFSRTLFPPRLPTSHARLSRLSLPQWTGISWPQVMGSECFAHLPACVIDLSIPPFSVRVGCVPVFLEPASKGHRFSANT